jgi:hypothetical protein
VTTRRSYVDVAAPRVFSPEAATKLLQTPYASTMIPPAERMRILPLAVNSTIS